MDDVLVHFSFLINYPRQANFCKEMDLAHSFRFLIVSMSSLMVDGSCGCGCVFETGSVVVQGRP